MILYREEEEEDNDNLEEYDSDTIAEDSKLVDQEVGADQADGCGNDISIEDGLGIVEGSQCNIIIAANKAEHVGDNNVVNESAVFNVLKAKNYV